MGTDLRFPHAVAGLRPTLRRIREGVAVLHGLFGGPKAPLGFCQRACACAEQPGILSQSQDIGDPPKLLSQFLYHAQHARDGKRRVPAHHNLHVREARLEAPNNAPEDAHRPTGRMGIARAEHCPHQLPPLAVKD